MPLEAGKLHHEIAARLRVAGIDTPMLDGRMIVLHVTGLTDVDLIARPQTPVCDEHVRCIEALTDRRKQGEPVSRLIGYREFFGREFQVTPATLDPRPDTEVLVEAAMQLLRDRSGDQVMRFLDIGTGTGCIAITLLAEMPHVTGMATDKSEDALKVCRSNAVALKVADRLEFMRTSWLDGVPGPFDLVVSNPPYIASQEIAGLAPGVREYDPGLALDGGSDGLDAYRAIFANVTSLIQAGGHVLVEFGSGQHEAVVQIAGQHGFVLTDDATGLIRDLAGIIRCAVFKIC